MPLATTSDLTAYGYTATEEALARAEARVRGYLARRASASSVLAGTVVPPALAELVCAIASRMASTLAEVSSGVRSEASGAVNVTYGAEAYAGVADLTGSEKAALDRLYPVGLRSVEL